MSPVKKTVDDVVFPPEEAQETLRAIQRGEIDAFMVRYGEEDQVLLVEGVDQPYRYLIERMNQGAVTLSDQGAIRYFNRRFAALVGESTESLVGRPLRSLVAEDDRPDVDELVRRAGSGDVDLEVRLSRVDGSLMSVLLSGCPLQEHEGVLCFIVTDLTEQKRLEAEREELLLADAARGAAESAAAVLLEADRRKDEALAILAHELRNPIATLSNGLIVLGSMTLEQPEARHTVERMDRQLKSLVRLIDDLNDAARVTQGKVELRREPTDLRSVVRRALESCRALIEGPGHDVTCELAAEPLIVDGDAVRLTQVVVNLLTNAAKFTPAGGKIGIACTPSRIAGFAEIRVRDNGQGIAPEILPRIFSLFVQAEPGAPSRGGGLGIGLSLARSLVELQGGVLIGTSDGLGKGAEFVARLPLV